MACNNCGQCDCRVIGGSGATVTGTGAQHDPYIVSMNSFAFETEDTDCIALDLDGSGTASQPYVLAAAPIIDSDPSNLLVCSGDGLLVGCESIMRDCVGQNLGCGLEFNNGLVCVMISEDDGNQIECRDDGLYASFDCDDLGCGLTMNGAGQISVNTGTAGNDKQGLICEDGVVKVDVLDCVTEPGGSSGLTFTNAGQLQLDSPQARDAAVVGSRNGNVATPIAIPATPVPGNGQVGSGICTNNIDPVHGNAIVVRNNPNCYRMTGWTTLQSQFELRIYPGTDVEVVLEQNINGIWVTRDKIFRRFLPPEAFGGDPDRYEIVSEFYTRMDINTIPASSFTTIGHRLCFRRTATDNGDQSTNFRADILDWSMTAANLFAWDR